MTTPKYCTRTPRPRNCAGCSQVNYGLDCANNPIPCKPITIEKESNMNKIFVSIAMPTTGESIEHLSLELFEKNITAELKHMFPDCPKILVNVFRHDGTGEDKIYFPKSDDDEYDYFRCALANAVGEAIADEASYYLTE